MYTDFCEAFDLIDHNILMTKIMRVKMSLHPWCELYLKNRSQNDDCFRFYMSRVPIPTGVPQGSHMGPLLF